MNDPGAATTPAAAPSAHPLTPRFAEASEYALKHHRHHRRKGTRIPYAAHVLAVAAIVLEMEASEDEAIAALLHDVIEDGGGERAEREIADRFGTEVAAIVRANSDTHVEPKPPWRQRKEDYIASIAAKPIAAVRVSIADKLHNATSIVNDHRRHGEAVWDRFEPDADAVLWYYRGLVEAFEARRPELGGGAAQALDRLAQTVDQMAEEVAAGHSPDPS